jgi:hypothetical protein
MVEYVNASLLENHKKINQNMKKYSIVLSAYVWTYSYTRNGVKSQDKHEIKNAYDFVSFPAILNFISLHFTSTLTNISLQALT